MTIEKSIKGVLVFNWKTSGIKFFKNLPKKNSPWDIPIKINLKVIIPDTPELTAKGEIILSETKCKELFIEAL